MHQSSLVKKRVKEIKRRTRKKYNTEEKIRIVLEGLKGESSIAGLCRREGINQNTYYRWSKDFLEAGKKRLRGDTVREANTSEVKHLRHQNGHLKQLVADLSLKNDVLKKLEWYGIRLGRSMRYTQAKKYETILMVEDSSMSVKRT